MAADNTIMIVGNLTDDPELRFTQSGDAVAGMRVAVTPRIRDGENWKDGETSFFRVNIWRQPAENVAESLTKGARVVVVGRLRMRSWETPEGDKRQVVEIEADEIAPSLKFATATVERKSASGNGGRQQRGDTKPSAGGTFDAPPPF